MSLSVIVCTHSRSSKLPALLESVGACVTYPGQTWEVIVVDNNPSGEARDVVAVLAAPSGGEYRYVHQPRRGKTRALNAGIRSARGALLAFTDDDVRVSPGWIASILREYEADRDLAGLGGRVELYNPEDLPITIRRSTSRAVISDQGFHVTNIPVIGCNLSFRKKVLEEVGLYDEALGPGSRVRSGDDSDILYRVVRRGYKLIYAPDVLVYHDHGRRDPADAEALGRRYLWGRGGFYCKYILKGDRHAATEAYHEVRKLLSELMLGPFRGGSMTEASSRLLTLMRGAVAYLVSRIAG